MSNQSSSFSKGVWKQEPLLHTPRELTHLAKSLLDPKHPELGGEHGSTGNVKDPENNWLMYMGGNKDSAAGECDEACNWVHDFLPHGSHQVMYDNARFANHYVHHVPTTEGMYVVDYTQRQFNANAKLPVVEPMAKYWSRKSTKQFQRMHSSNIDLYRSDKKGNIDPNQ